MKGNENREARGSGLLTSEYSVEREKAIGPRGCRLNTHAEGVKPVSGSVLPVGGDAA